FARRPRRRSASQRPPWAHWDTAPPSRRILGLQALLTPSCGTEPPHRVTKGSNPRLAPIRPRRAAGISLAALRLVPYASSGGSALVPGTRRQPLRSRAMRVWPGNPYPLGATWDGAGVNFALFPEHATKVELCLFEATVARNETQRITLPEQT